MLASLQRLFMDEHGQGMTEYGIVLGFLSIAALIALGSLRTEVVEMFSNITNALISRDGDGPQV
ncbi:Flp family type IVb pilin [Brevibacillus sp. SYSU BS000544]|uniref:Flp family type IVb pilin n=1 Tax=Brevibacillus sp. SYSU BS000544 TaxID=3416443 RepID=UPI003CE58175